MGESVGLPAQGHNLGFRVKGLGFRVIALAENGHTMQRSTVAWVPSNLSSGTR